jgi:hypothetical protein
MDANEILNEYLNLDIKEKIRFKVLMNDYDKLEKLEKRIEIAKTLTNIVNENGESYLSSDWVKTNILKIKNG